MVAPGESAIISIARDNLSVRQNDSQSLSKVSLSGVDINQLTAAEISKLYKNHHEVFLEAFKNALNSGPRVKIRECLRLMNKTELEEFLQDNNLFNLELQFGNHIFKTNRALLIAQSSYFERMFKSGLLETSATKVTLQDRLPSPDPSLPDLYFSYDVFSRAFDAFIFDLANDLQLSSDNLEEYLALASIYEMESVTQACEKWILEKKREISSREVYYLATKYNLSPVSNALVPDLLKACFCKTRSRPSAVKNAASFTPSCYSIRLNPIFRFNCSIP